MASRDRRGSELRGPRSCILGCKGKRIVILKLADTAHRSLIHCKRPASGPLLSQPPPSPPSTSRLSPSYPCARSGDVAVLPLSSCPAVRAEPSASVSLTPQAELLRGAHGAGTELRPAILRAFGKAGGARAVLGEAAGSGEDAD